MRCRSDENVEDSLALFASAPQGAGNALAGSGRYV